MEAGKLNLLVLDGELAIQEPCKVVTLVEEQLLGLPTSDGLPDADDEGAAVAAEDDRVDVTILLQ